MKELRPRFSLLFADPKGPEDSYPSHVPAFAGQLSPDPVSDGKIKEILALRTTRKDIVYRKEILEDFLHTPSLLTKCETVAEKWEGLHETARREEPLPEGASLSQALEVLKINTVSLMEHLKFLRVAAEEMASQTPKSQGLFAFSEFLTAHASSPQVKHLTEAALGYPLLQEDRLQTVLHLSAAPTGEITHADLRYLGPDPEGFLRKHPLSKEGFSADLPREEDRTAEAIGRLSESFRLATKALREAFLPLKEGLIFYHFALSLTEWGNSKGFPWLFPAPLGDGAPVGRGIRDIRESFLPTEGPMDFTAAPLEVYRGERGTERLQTLARTQLFAGAGLPILAEEAVFCPEARVVVCDCSDKTPDEQVALLADLFRETKPKDILLLNHPLHTPGLALDRERLSALLMAFRKKGALLRLAVTWPEEDV